MPVDPTNNPSGSPAIPRKLHPTWRRTLRRFVPCRTPQLNRARKRIPQRIFPQPTHPRFHREHIQFHQLPLRKFLAPVRLRLRFPHRETHPARMLAIKRRLNGFPYRPRLHPLHQHPRPRHRLKQSPMQTQGQGQHSNRQNSKQIRHVDDAASYNPPSTQVNSPPGLCGCPPTLQARHLGPSSHHIGTQLLLAP